EKSFARDESVRQRQLADQDYASKQARDAALKLLAVSTARLDSARASLANAKQTHRHDLEGARARVRAAKASLSDARTQLSYATIRAPIDGTVASVSTDEGETVAAGLQAPTFVTILDLDRLRVDAFVDEVDIAKVEPDQEVQFSVDAHPARDFEGRVRTIYPNALTDDDVVYYRVVIDLSAPDARLLRPKMTADVTIFRQRRDDVLAVPARSIERVDGRDVVYARAGSAVEPREVKLGARDGQWVEVVEGLDGGETILLEPPSPSDPS
ncbi:MAG: efflux RND transporter periplasmic adaptor subunit, partial [Persicimonas sp.]